MYQAFVDGWGTTSVFTLDNEAPPDGFPPDAPWVRVAIRHRDSDQESVGDVGARKFTRSGSLFVQCFSPLAVNGLVSSDTLAATARGIFEGVTLTPENVRFTDCVVREIGDDGDGYFQVNVECFFNYTETK